MEIYEIYQIFIVFFALIYGNGTVNARVLYGALFAGVLLWLVLFVLQGAGLYVMAKNRGIKKKWLAFVPFANIWYMGRLAGTCNVFGRKMEKPGLYAMIASIASFLVVASAMAVQIVLTAKFGDYIVQDESGYKWANLTGGAVYAYNYFQVSYYLIPIFRLAYMILMFILLTGLYKKYYARGYLLLSWVALFVPVSRYIAVFVLRNNRAIDYEAYMRAKREEFLRRQQQYNPYGFSPYNRNPYNQPPNGGTPYGSPDGYDRPRNDGGNGASGEDPFSEFAPGTSDGAGRNENSGRGGPDGTGSGRTGNGSDSDDLFN